MNDIKLKDFIKVYDNAVSLRLCEKIVDEFEKQHEHHENSVVGNIDEEFNDYRQAIEMNCSKIANENEEWKLILNSLNNIVVGYMHRYIYDMKMLGISDIAIPNSNILEEWRMHKYEKDTHFYKKHVDSHDSNSSNRMLAFLFYPNTVPAGGQTAFCDHLSGIDCQPIQGRLLVFPTWFGYPHEAKPVIEGTKYMIKTFVHYPGELEID